MANAVSELPSSNSPNLALLHPTPEEKLAIWKLNGQTWRGSMDISTYLRREQHLENQALTRDGGITFWILVDASLPPNARPILSSCESLRKRAVILQGNSAIKDITSHGVGSVFCNPEYRGRGYAHRMINELGKMLDNWQQKNDERASFTVLYSDIGKTFYSIMGWYPFPSSHIALPPVSSQEKSSEAQYLDAQDLLGLCELDEQWIREAIGRSQSSSARIRVALIPDVKTMQWHHAREEFAGQAMIGRDPESKGAFARTEAGDRVWCIWTRTFGENKAGNILNILRFVIEGDQLFRSDVEEPSRPDASEEAKIQAGAAVLRVAQLEAANWNMNGVQLWNPTPLTILAAQAVDPSSQLIYRDKESIASLRWHAVDPRDRHKVDWIGNEKYGWC